MKRRSPVTTLVPSSLAAATPASLFGQEFLRVQNNLALRPFHAAWANRGSSPCTFAVVGDSKSEGQNSDVGATYLSTWPRYLHAALKTRGQPAGITGGDGFIPGYYAVTAPTAQGFALSGTTALQTSRGGPGLRGVRLDDTTATMTITKTCSSFDVHYFNQTSGSKFSVQIDGGTVTTVTTNATSNSQKWNSGALTAGSHTIVIKYVSGSAGQVYIEGAFFYNGDETAGIRYVDGSHFGYTTSNFATQAQYSAQSLFLMGPQLIFVKLGTNDYSAITPTAFETNLHSIIDTGTYSLKNLYSGVTPPSVVLVVPQPRTTAYLSGYVHADYQAAAYRVAASSPANVALLDLGLRMPADNASDRLGLTGSDGVHENSKGYRFIADLVERFLFA